MVVPSRGPPPQITSACPVCRQGGFQGGCFKLWRVRRAGESAGGGGGVPLRVRHAKGAVAGCYFATCGEPGAPASRLCRLLSSTLLEVLALGESGVPASQLVGASGAPRRVRHASEVVAGGVASPPWRIRYAGGHMRRRVACVFCFIFQFIWVARRWNSAGFATRRAERRRVWLWLDSRLCVSKEQRGIMCRLGRETLDVHG